MHLPATEDSDRVFSLSLFAALVITTIQFRFINAQCPNVKLGSVIDDRNFRGPCCDVIKAVQLALKFDDDAGLKNNHAKFAALSTCPSARDTLRHTSFGGHAIKVTLEDTLVGTTITTRRAPRRAKQDQRIMEGIKATNTASRTTADTELKKHAHMMAAIPKILHGTLWTFPSATSTSTMRASAVKCIGQFDSMRCPEAVIAILNNPVRADPIATICYRGICDPGGYLSDHQSDTAVSF